jgi:hypothetical protein
MAMPIRDRETLQEDFENQTAKRPAVRRERSGTTTRSRTRTAVAVVAPIVDSAEEAARLQQERLELIAALEVKRNELIERLDKGAARIEDSRTQGRDVSEWEDYWVQLLRNYEKICDQLTELD